jgi:hypothetical protein
MKIPADLLWGLTRKNSSFLVKRHNETFTHDPTSTTNLHNAADCGVANNNAVSITLTKAESKSKKAHKRVYQVNQRHPERHGTPAPRAGSVYSVQNLTKETARANKVIDSLKVSDEKKKQLRRRLYKLHKGNPLNVKKSHIHKAAK